MFSSIAGEALINFASAALPLVHYRALAGVPRKRGDESVTLLLVALLLRSAHDVLN